MANFDQLKQSVAALIRTNGAEEITGQIMQDVLLTIINSISGGYMFGGVAQHNGNVGNPDYNVFYLAGSGAYTGYGGAITIENGCYGVFRYNGVWTQEVVDIGVRLSGSIVAGETRGVTGDTINTALQTLFDNVMNILDSLTFTYNTPSAQQATKAMLDVIMTPTGGAPHVLTTLTLASATVAAAGLMSAEDKQKVDRMLTDFRSLSLTDTTVAADQATKIVQTLSATLGENPEAITTMTFLAATASKAGLMSAADKSYLDSLPAVLTGINGAISDNLARVLAMMGYYECSTAEGTAAKVVSASGYILTSGGCIRIKMTNANTANNVTLNINSTGAKALYYDGAQASSTNTWEAGEVLEVYYDGTQYQCASGGGGKFATGENVGDVSITHSVTTNSDGLPTAGAVKSSEDELLNSIMGVDASPYNSGGHIYSDGSVYSSSSFVYSDYIPCEAGDVVEWYPSYGSGVYLALYDSNKTFVRSYNSTEQNYRFTVPAGATAYLRSSALISRMSESYVKINGELVWCPAGIHGLIDDKLQPIYDKFNANGMFSISGANNTYAQSAIITGVVAGHTYNLNLKFPNIDMSGVTYTGSGYIRLALKVFDGETDMGNLVDIRVGTALSDRYKFTIPSNIANPSVQVWMRFTSGYTEMFSITEGDGGGSSAGWETLTAPVIARRGAYWNTGQVATSLNSTSATDYVDVSSYKQIRCMMSRVNAIIDGAAGGIVFYDANKAYLKGYYYRTVDGTNVSMSSTEVRVFDIPTGAKYVIINMLNDHVSQFFAEGRRNIEAEVKNGDNYYDKYANIGHPSIYRSQPTADANVSLNGKTVDELYAEYDDLATRFPDYFRRTADIATVTKSNVSYVSRSYELRYNKYFQQLSEPTEGQVIDYDLNIWTGKYNPRKIIVISGMHGEEKTPTWGLMLSIKEILESNEDWALFIRANCVLAIAPCVNPSGWQDVVRTDSEGHDMNRNTSYADPECVGLLKWHYDNRDAEVAFDVHGSQGRYMYFPNSNWYPMANIHNRFYGRLVVAMQNEWKTFYDSISQGYGTTYAPFMLLQQGNGEGYPTSFASWSTRLAYKIGMQRLPLETPDSLSTGNRSNNDLRMCKLTKDMFINLLMIHIGVKDMPKNDINRQVVDMPEPGWNT